MKGCDTNLIEREIVVYIRGSNIDGSKNRNRKTLLKTHELLLTVQVGWDVMNRGNPLTYPHASNRVHSCTKLYQMEENDNFDLVFMETSSLFLC